MDAPMEGASVPGAVGSEMDVGQLNGELKQVVADVEAAGREWGVRPDSREGRFVSALLGTVGWLGRLGEASRASLEAVARENREAAETELAQARELTRVANTSLAQARSLQVFQQSERDSLVARMIQETLPLFAKNLRDVMVIREQRWNRDQSRRRYALAGAVALAVFLAGYGLRAGADWGDAGFVDRCLAHSVPSQGHVFCDMTALAAGAAD